MLWQKNLLGSQRFRLIIVTGASRGLGKAIIERLHEKGEEVIGLTRSKNNLGKNSIQCDVSEYLSVKNAAKKVKQMKNKFIVLQNFQ